MTKVGMQLKSIIEHILGDLQLKIGCTYTLFLSKQLKNIKKGNKALFSHPSASRVVSKSEVDEVYANLELRENISRFS